MDYDTIRHSTTHPKFLHSNSTSHKFAFGAIAELVDNSVDAEATTLKIEIFPEVERESNKENENENENKESNKESERVNPSQMIFTDNGTGMDFDHVHKMLSFGHCDKIEKDGKAPIGHYGNGFKSGAMRLGRNAIVFSTNGFTRTVGLLSQTFLEVSDAKEVLVPLASWFIETNEYCLSSAGTDRDLKIIYEFSPFKSLEELSKQFKAIGKHGTRIIIFELRRKDDNESLEFNFVDNYQGLPDIRLVEDIESAILPTSVKNAKEPNIHHYSLRAYLSILYLNPTMQIILRGRKVRAQRLLYSLYKPAQFTYIPKESNGQSVTITYGFNKRNFRSEYGLMLYNKGRLIVSFLRVGIQLSPASPGIGVMGIVDTTLVQPTHNKQDFIYDKNYNLLINNMKDLLKQYWKELEIPNGETSHFFGKIEKSAKLGPYFVQCDECFKWRPVNQHPENFPEKWTCSMNEDTNQNACVFEEETINPVEACRRMYRKRNNSKAIETLKDQEQKAREAWLKKVKRLREATAKKISKSTGDDIDRVYLALKVTDNNEEKAKTWLNEHDVYDIKELEDMYGGTDVKDMDEQELSFYGNPDVPQEATEEEEAEETEDTEDTEETEDKDEGTEKTHEVDDFIRYPPRQRKAIDHFTFAETSKRSTSTPSSSTPKRSSTPSSSSASSASSSSSSSSSSSKRSSVAPTKQSPAARPATKHTGSSSSPSSRQSSTPSSSSSRSSSSRPSSSSSSSRSTATPAKRAASPPPQLPISRRRLNPAVTSNTVIPTRAAEDDHPPMTDEDHELNIPPGMSSDSGENLCYNHSAHFSKKCVWCKIVCDKLRRLFTELSGTPYNCGDALDQDVDDFIDNMITNFRNNIINAPRGSRNKVDLFHKKDKNQQRLARLQTARIKQEATADSTDEEEDQAMEDEEVDVRENAEAPTHVQSPVIKRSPPPSPVPSSIPTRTTTRTTTTTTSPPSTPNTQDTQDTQETQDTQNTQNIESTPSTQIKTEPIFIETITSTTSKKVPIFIDLVDSDEDEFLALL